MSRPEVAERVGGTLGGFPVVAAGAGEAVLFKPAGVAAEMRADRAARSLLERVRRDGWPEARLPHRIDKVTSGLQVVAVDAAAAAHHGRELQARRWDKWYVARIPVDGPADADLLGIQKRYLERDGRVARVVRSGGAVALQEVLAVAPDPADAAARQVLVRLLSGRYHQVRAILADVGAPLLGDERYGGTPRRDGPWLEHVALRLRPLGADRRVTVHLAAGLGRVPLAGPLAVALRAAIDHDDQEDA